MADTSDTQQRPWVAIQRNRSSGSGRGGHHLLELVRHLRRLGLTPRLFSRRDDLDLAVRNPERRPHLIAIVAAGGDGTVLDLVNRHSDVPLFVFPMGTENLLAKFLQIGRNGQRAAEIIAAGQRQRFDLGVWNGKSFLIMVSCGIDAEIVQEVQRRRRAGHVRHWNYLWPILRAVWNFRPRQIRISTDDSDAPLTGELVVVANFNSYACGLNLVPAASANDGQLNARIFRVRSRFELIATLLRLFFGRQLSPSNVIDVAGPRFRIESDPPIAIQVDGDAAGTTPVVVSLSSRTIEFLIPS